MAQTDELLAILRSRGDRGLTPLEAFPAIGTLRLAARIHDLRAAGHAIDTVTEQRGTKRWARYVLKPEMTLGL